jgi:probable F420-dependent oxidoreductase
MGVGGHGGNRGVDMADQRVSFGIFPACTDQSMPIVDLARAAEQRGFSGIFLNEHTHIPIEHPRSTFPAGGPIPERYKRFWDPYVALSFVAATTGLEIGTCVSLVGEHDAIALAKAIATLDVLSNGRFVLGIGFGWHREEFEDHGLPAKRRATVVRETVELMRALWTEDAAEYEGTYRRLARSWAWPKPCQQPHPPVLLGAPASAHNFARVAAWADGWIPMGSPLLDEDFERELTDLRAVWERAGRDPAALRVTAIQWPVRPDRLRAAIDRAGELGVERVVLYMGDESEAEALRTLDHAAAVSR